MTINGAPVRCSYCQEEIVYRPDDPVIHIGCAIAEDSISKLVAIERVASQLVAIEQAARAMFAAEHGVCVECGWVGDHASADADEEARECLTLPLRAALAATNPEADKA